MTNQNEPLTPHDDAALDAFFVAARAAQPAPPHDLMARILDDAQTAQPPRRLSLWARLKTALEPVGGLAGATGLAACAVFGVSLGYTGSGGVDALLETVSLTSFDLDSAVDYFDVGSISFDELEG